MGRVQLYCPSTKRTVDDFVIGAFQLREQVLQGVRIALDIKHAALYTTEGKPISDPSTLQEDQRVLVAASKDEIMQPDAPYGYVLYQGEEIGDVDEETEGYGLDWQDLTEQEKCIHVASLAASKPTTRNKLRITREYAAVHNELLAIQQQEDLSSNSSSSINSDANANANDNATQPQNPPSTSQYEDLIQERWGISLDTFVRQMHASTLTTTASKRLASKPLPASSLAPSTVAALAVLSSMTHGQARLAGEMLSEAIAGREENDTATATAAAAAAAGTTGVFQLREDDVKNAVDMVFERAGLLAVKGGRGKVRKRAKGRGRKERGGVSS